MISMKFQLLLGSLLSQIKVRHWWLGILLWIALVAPAQASVILRVAIERGVNQARVGSSTTAIVKDSTGRTLGQLPAMSSFYAQAVPGGVALDKWQSGLFWIEPSGKGFVYIGDRWFRGRTLVVPTEKGIDVVNWVDLEEYLYSVVGGEMNSSWPGEALKAQAIAARTYALYKREQQRSNPVYDLGDTPDRWQIYKGVSSESPSTYAAVDATAGQVLTYNNNLILSVFHACSGGHTENVEDVWSNPLPYLRAVQDYDQNIKECNWQRTFTPTEISSRISGVGNIREVVAESFSPFRSVKALRVVGDKGTKVLRGEEVRTALKLRSTRFNVTRGADGSFTLQGAGFGHGLGMSQWGAYNLALRGANHLQILGHYYQGVALTPIKAK
ncbi:sporulation protein SpoIID-like protein [Trichormus variabilis ATCC 29413]|uniref:Sporulation protein SpoIID-like protein n=2 Tax=Anabaena variabilis TaxID=264691 RepID=Q3M5B9_TRIV2|nr:MULTISPECIES: SpoIID/LytB domain-containing protein [Nostocaceae]ABA23817.1 sporulation protein SpoIID-like protein [Trichormus variabilis ATCC 29413]MBC1214494.1 SpoIID/LytB domain-containing protein [Trichormus variabilis ARAD]MBC1253883.1 SpoIID/LytB domain-containing protein [Trichormus variabilis V5]MBC1266414.1 SpoIID/LytB domain-containing protein [Trichormus variabilis FSR]MBC1300297.1 SpoIID/LytB domain-containing protein [Trichormus variabilis N2B]